jgi:hypothetical protein
MTFGCSVAEAMARLSYPEFRQWCKYRRKRGGLNVGMRVERGAALVASVLVNANRDIKKKPTPYAVEDFMPHADVRELSLEQAMESWA